MSKLKIFKIAAGIILFVLILGNFLMSRYAVELMDIQARSANKITASLSQEYINTLETIKKTTNLLENQKILDDRINKIKKIKKTSDESLSASSDISYFAISSKSLSVNLFFLILSFSILFIEPRKEEKNEE